MKIIRNLKKIKRSNKQFYFFDFKEQDFLLFRNEIDRQIYICQKKDIHNVGGKIISPICPYCNTAVWNAGQVCSRCGTDPKNMFSEGGVNSSFRFVGRRDFILENPSLISEVRSVWNDLHFHMKNGLIIKLSAR